MRENKCDRSLHHSEHFCLPGQNPRSRNKLAILPNSALAIERECDR
ncbi:hypothetical protein QUB47_26385 [Microcoleus sp. AT9_B5]